MIGQVFPKRGDIYITAQVYFYICCWIILCRLLSLQELLVIVHYIESFTTTVCALAWQHMTLYPALMLYSDICYIGILDKISATS